MLYRVMECVGLFADNHTRCGGAFYILLLLLLLARAGSQGNGCGGCYSGRLNDGRILRLLLLFLSFDFHGRDILPQVAYKSITELVKACSVWSEFAVHLFKSYFPACYEAPTLLTCRR